MICPRCNIPLETVIIEETNVHKCSDCGGHWLERYELNKIAHPIDGDIEFSSLHPEHPEKLNDLECPKCNVVMKKINFNVLAHIHIDHCDDCGGFWLDKGELTQINREIDKLNDVHDSPVVIVTRFIARLGSFFN
ncbi:MAG: zf-TFIIB domain-containing protein [Candidatus Marinimicrobia bacterium]|nr:zf-TFIIB domain-containing protein [Candidatus Neomarinimicrobiota bacterium]MBL7023520.1 zf-TFIIB domain-containing protein [Candidatus Neomarinimicrobiota bacterium]MBL7109422.1 zf-TFIIB domain-containing protein [Candidatus Neomarinimicrobiota bacterium]